jgi:hypothetical protein
MSAKPISDNVLIETATFLNKSDSIREAAKLANVNESTFRHRVNIAVQRGFVTKKKKEHPLEGIEPGFLIEELPDPEAPVDEIIDQAINNFHRRSKASQARDWLKIKIKTDGPFGIASFGDPHIDDNGCNWPLLKRDVELVKNTEALWGLGLGDYTNNWSGRLIRLYKEQEITRSKALRLAQWFFKEVPWILLIKGNHDLWSSQIGSHGDPLDFMERGCAPLEDWQAKVEFSCPNGKEFKVWAAHDFSGHSIYNPLHSNMRKAKFTGGLADIYISGDKHNWAMFFNEDPDNKTVYWAVRARGYKFIDEYARNLGFADQQYGATILTVFDPYAEGPGQIQCFADLEEGIEFLEFKRKKFKATNA